ncbi:hypothetical protein Tco_0425849, partial [Tanacetum coccineum]
TMAYMNIPVNDAPAEQAPGIAPSTRTDDQILPLSKWVPIGKSNCVLDVQKDALDCTPTNDNNPFMAPPSSDTVIEYVNTMGYPILWGVIHHSNIDYAERIWEEFVQSIQTFLTDRKNLTTASRGKKKTAHLLITSVRFTKLTIHHLKTKHNIHPRTGLPLHYSHNENVLNTLMFIGKDGREIFGMPIPDALLTDDIKGAPYYDEYMEHVAKYQQHLDAEHGMENEGGATESPKATKVTKPKATKVTKPAGYKAPKPTSSQPPKPTPTQTEPSKKDQGKKGKLVKETSDAPSPTKELFIRRTLIPTESSGHAESPSIDAKLALTDSETESNKEAPEIHAGDQDEGQAGPNPGEQDEGQAGPNLVEQDEGRARSNPGDAAESQS